MPGDSFQPLASSEIVVASVMSRPARTALAVVFGHQAVRQASGPQPWPRVMGARTIRFGRGQVRADGRAEKRTLFMACSCLDGCAETTGERTGLVSRGEALTRA